MAARILYIGLWTDADDQGLFEWKPLQLKMRLLPADNVDAQSLLSELESAGLIKPYDGDDCRMGAIKDFRKFQRPQKPNAVHRLPDDLRAYVRIDSEEYDPATVLRKELCESQGHTCYYCLSDITHYSKKHNSCEIDHRIPKSQGGSDERSNLVAACRSCNRGKNDKSESEWFAIIKDRARKSAEKSANTVVAQQMEDGGWRMEDGESNLSPNGDCPPKADPLPIREAFDLWNELAGRIGLPVARDLTDKRRASIKSRLAFSGLDGWLEALRAVENSPMCRGENSRGWRADLDFVCQQKSFTKLIEGSYAGSPKQKENRNDQSYRSNRAEQRDAWAEILTQGHSESAGGGEPLRITG